MKSLKVEKTIMGFYNKQELEKLFEVAKGHKLELAILIASHYGFRRSELVGLRWKAIDFDHNSITVNHKVLMVEGEYLLDDELKTNASYRTLPLLPHLVKNLTEHRNKIDENKRFFGNSYNHKFDEYIFVDEKGDLFRPTYLTHAFNKFLKNNNLKHIRLHDLRHSCASLLLANGISMKQIQDWLGHADFATTADRYTHLDYNSKIQSANAISNAFAKKQSEPIIMDFTDLKEFSLKVSENMKRLDITNVSDYIKFLDEARRLSDSKETLSPKKSEFSM